MDDSRWSRVEDLFHQAADHSPEERKRFLDDACAGNQDLRREVEFLLEADAPGDDFLGAAIIQAAQGLPANEDQGEDLTGHKFGLYRITGLIGRGGMGAVYRAIREDDFHMEVAIKLLKRGTDTDAALQRFRSERQILAWLLHPNISRLLDGGASPDGRPYFVMEYVEGEPLTEYCKVRKLIVRERLDLFRAVCSAVHYAHQNLIVHRDLKPGNILVTSGGVPKLLDFGIAKILRAEADASMMTAPTTRLMTPEYASPEQVRGEPITTASDVFSLGAVLYELLTGRPPFTFQTRTPEEVASVICEQEPETPSRVLHNGGSEQTGHELQGDLDNIILRAMHKEPQRRYASVEQLSEDLGRYLAGMPVIAHRDSTSYRAGKFIRRHKVGVLASAAVALSLVVGIVTATWQARIAASERRKAEKRFNDVRRLANSMLFELHDGIQALHGSIPARELLLKRALEYLDSLAAEADGNIPLQRELAEAYERVGRLQGYPGEANVGQTTAAIESLQKSLAIREKAAAAEPSSREARSELARAYNNMGTILRAVGEHGRALEFVRRSLAIREELSSSDPANRQFRLQLANGIHYLASSLVSTGDLAGTLEARRRALAIYEELAKAEPANMNYQRNLGLGYKYLGAVHVTLGRFDDGLKSYRSALGIDEARLAADPFNADARMDVSFDLSDIGYVLWQTKALPEALSHYRKALAIREALAAADPKDFRAKYAMTETLERIGLISLDMGRRSGALAELAKVRALREELARKDPANADYQFTLARVYKILGDVHGSAAKAANRKDSCQEAGAWYRRGLGILERLEKRGAVQVEERALSGQIRKALELCETERAAVRSRRAASDSVRTR